MYDQLAKRLQALQEEYQKGQKKLEDMDREGKLLYETLLRISGAIQVIQEELSNVNGQLSETPKGEGLA